MLLAILMKDLSQTKMYRNAHWVELEAMLEVLLSLGHLVRVGKLGSKVDTGSKVRLVVQKALFEVVDRLL